MLELEVYEWWHILISKLQDKLYHNHKDKELHNPRRTNKELPQAIPPTIRQEVRHDKNTHKDTPNKAHLGKYRKVVKVEIV